jgi:hypothetical protein
MELGNGLRAGRVSLRDFFACLGEGPNFLCHIRVNSILVVDHLGQNIPVPTNFCSTWEVRFLLCLYLSLDTPQPARVLTTSSEAIANIALAMAL